MFAEIVLTLPLLILNPSDLKRTSDLRELSDYGNGQVLVKESLMN